MRACRKCRTPFEPTERQRRKSDFICKQCERAKRITPENGTYTKDAMPVREIARIMNTTVTSVESTIKRALWKLRDGRSDYLLNIARAREEEHFRSGYRIVGTEL